MRLLLRCNGFNNSFAVNFHSFCPSFFCFPFILFFFPFFLVGLEYCTLKNLEHFSFNSVRWGGSWYFRPSSREGLANFTPTAGMGHLISEPKGIHCTMWWVWKHICQYQWSWDKPYSPGCNHLCPMLQFGSKHVCIEDVHIFKQCHEMTLFLLRIETYCISCVV